MHMHTGATSTASSKATQGHIINLGWRYDLMLWWMNLQSRGKLREIQSRIVDLAQFQPGETVLDVGCGTGTLALKAYARVGATGHVYGIDPGPKQPGRVPAGRQFLGNGSQRHRYFHGPDAPCAGNRLPPDRHSRHPTRPVVDPGLLRPRPSPRGAPATCGRPVTDTSCS